ncbi:phage tail protein [Variovorax boronicumulans]
MPSLFFDPSLTPVESADRMARAQFEASQTDRMANVPTTVGPRELVLGRVRKGGNVFFRASWGPGSPVFVMCIALASHEIANVERVYFNDIPVDLDAGGNVMTAPWGRNNTRTSKDTSAQPVRTLDGTPIPGTLSVMMMQEGVIGSSDAVYPNGVSNVEYTLDGLTLTITNYDPTKFYTVAYQWTQFVSTARVYPHHGTDSQAADAHLLGYFPGMWTSERRAAGVSYLVCEFTYEETSFPSGLPQVTALVAGAMIYDPRNGVTNFTENPALHMRHVLLHPQFGKRTSLTAAEDARIIAAANACDQVVNYAGAPDNVAQFRSGTVATFGTPTRDILDDLAQAMGGMWAYAAGEFYVRPGVWSAPVLSLNESDLAVVRGDSDGGASQAPITINVHKARVEKVNVVVPRIWDRAQGGMLAALTPLKATQLIARDGAELVQEVTMPAVFYSYQALHIAAMLIRDARDPLAVTLPFKLRAYPLELFDSITLTLPRYGWANKEFVMAARGRELLERGRLIIEGRDNEVQLLLSTVKNDRALLAPP